MRARLGWRFAAVVAVAAGFGLVGRPAETRAGARAGDAIIFTLKKDFVKENMDRVTIDVDMSVDKVGPIHSAKNDGEVHVAGRSKQIGLPFVAEVMHAKAQKTAVKAMRAAEGKEPIKVKGAWRFWCEHAEGVNQRQGDAKFGTPAKGGSNPSHVFEIHPVTHVAGEDIEDSIGHIEGFKYKKPDVAFTHYENVRCNIKVNPDESVTIKTGMAGYNIPEFILELDDGKQVVVPDDKGGGRFVFGAIRDLDGELIVRKLRCAVIKDTEAEAVIRNTGPGKRLHVAGMPRISLKLIDERIKLHNEGDTRDPLNWDLPYEIIIVAVLEGADD